MMRLLLLLGLTLSNLAWAEVVSTESKFAAEIAYYVTLQKTSPLMDLLHLIIKIFNTGIILVLTSVAVGSLFYAGALAASEGKGIGRKINAWVMVRTLAGFAALIPLSDGMGTIQHMVGGVVTSSSALVARLSTGLYDLTQPDETSQLASGVAIEGFMNYANEQKSVQDFKKVMQSVVCAIDHNTESEDSFVFEDPLFTITGVTGGKFTFVGNCGELTATNNAENVELMLNAIIQTTKAIVNKVSSTINNNTMPENWSFSTFALGQTSIKSNLYTYHKQMYNDWIVDIPDDVEDVESKEAMDDWIIALLSGDVNVSNIVLPAEDDLKLKIDSFQKSELHTPASDYTPIAGTDSTHVQQVLTLVYNSIKDLSFQKQKAVQSATNTKDRLADKIEAIRSQISIGAMIKQDVKTALDPSNKFGGGGGLNVNTMSEQINLTLTHVISTFKSLLIDKTYHPLEAVQSKGVELLKHVAEDWHVGRYDLAVQTDKVSKIHYTAASAAYATAAGAYAISGVPYPGGVKHFAIYMLFAGVDNLIDALGILADLDVAHLFRYEPFGGAMSILFFIWGAFFGILLPVIPSLIITFSLISWVLLVVEAMLASPLIALGLAHPSSQQFFGASEQSVMLFLQLFLRPVLIFLAVLFSGLLSYCGLTILNESMIILLDTLLPTTVTNIWVDGFILIMAFMVYGYLAFLVLIQCFAIIGMLPDRMASWIGSGPLGQENVLQQVLGVRSSVEGAAQKVGQGGATAASERHTEASYDVSQALDSLDKDRKHKATSDAISKSDEEGEERDDKRIGKKIGAKEIDKSVYKAENENHFMVKAPTIFQKDKYYEKVGDEDSGNIKFNPGWLSHLAMRAAYSRKGG